MSLGVLQIKRRAEDDLGSTGTSDVQVHFHLLPTYNLQYYELREIISLLVAELLFPLKSELFGYFCCGGTYVITPGVNYMPKVS
jgi:hypothetical protein